MYKLFTTLFPSKSTSTNESTPTPTSTNQRTLQKYNKNSTNINAIYIRDIGKGGFGKVKLYKSTTNSQFYAIKKTRKHKQHYKFLKNEKNMICKLGKNNFIIQLYSVIESERSYCLALEYCENGDLWYYIRKKGPFKEDTARFIIGCLILGVKHIHSHNIIHRDISPSNLLVTKEGYVKICDFGLSTIASDDNELIQGSHGTLDYISPEMVLYTGHNKKTDLWSIGAILYDVLAGIPPFYDEDRNVTAKNITIKNYKRILVKTAVARELIDGIFKLNRNDRYTLFQIMTHTWYKGFNWLKLSTQEIPSPLLSF